MNKPCPTGLQSGYTACMRDKERHIELEFGILALFVAVGLGVAILRTVLALAGVL